MTQHNNKRIAQNTLFLYFRMLLIMGVSLYTSRVILDKLGSTDYALYNAVGGVATILTFLNGTLSIGTSRFITFELGKCNINQLKTTFSTTFYAHLLLAFIIVLLMETGGLWFLYNKLIIPPDRLFAANVVFQLSLLTVFINITQVPYTSAILAHEDMSVYAYVSIFETLGKLVVVYLLSIANYDKLIIYSILICIVQFFVAIFYRLYCTRHYKEAILSLSLNHIIFKNLLGFTGWNVIANLSETLKQQGLVILFNLFFQPTVVAAQAIGNQIAGQMMNFYNNFRLAINPQIIKLYAVGDYELSRRMTLQSTVYVFDLTLLIALPLILVMDPLIHLWLVEVPEYTVTFSQYIIIQCVVSSISGSLYIAMVASGRLKSNSIAAAFGGIGQFILIYILFKLNGGAMWAQYIYLANAILWSALIKPYILWREIGYSLVELTKCLWNCLKVTLLALMLAIPFNYFMGNSFIEYVAIVIESTLSVIVASWIFLDRPAKQKITDFIKRKMNSY